MMKVCTCSRRFQTGVPFYHIGVVREYGGERSRLVQLAPTCTLSAYERRHAVNVRTCTDRRTFETAVNDYAMFDWHPRVRLCTSSCAGVPCFFVMKRTTATHTWS